MYTINNNNYNTRGQCTYTGTYSAYVVNGVPEYVYEHLFLDTTSHVNLQELHIIEVPCHVINIVMEWIWER